MDKFDASDALAKSVVKPLHSNLVSGRRISRICQSLVNLLPAQESMTGLDVGCGSGELAARLMQARPLIECKGVEVLVRPGTFIPVSEFDGVDLPFDDNSFDFVMLVDVLHHTDKQIELLRECQRVASKFVLIKDHYCDSALDRMVLSFMDWVGNRAYSVALPYNYLSRKSWRSLFADSKLKPEETIEHLHLYPAPASFIFDANLHFAVRLLKL